MDWKVGTPRLAALDSLGAAAVRPQCTAARAHVSSACAPPALASPPETCSCPDQGGDAAGGCGLQGGQQARQCPGRQQVLPGAAPLQQQPQEPAATWTACVHALPGHRLRMMSATRLQ